MDEKTLDSTIWISVKLRGLVLDATVEIERKIDDFLSIYFCRNEMSGNELKEMLWCTERITLGSKKDILFMILNRNYKEFLKQHSRFVSCLENLIPHRNIFAHMEMDLDYSDYDIGNFEIKFKKYHKGKLTIKRYNKADVEKIRDDFDHVNSILNLLIKLINVTD